MDPTPKIDKHVSALRDVVQKLEDASRRRAWAELEDQALELSSLTARILTRARTVRELTDEGVL